MPIPQLKKTDTRSWSERQSGMKTNRMPKKRRLVKKLGVFLVVLVGLLFFAGLGYAAWISRDLPNPNQLLEREIAQSTKIYDRSGEHVLYEISGDEKRTLVSLEDIPDHVEQATIAIEDKNFYKHGGFSFFALARTAVTNVIFKKNAGGSTLTQQFIKNAVLTPEKTYTRKIKELIMAYRLERKFNKDDILQMYLNEIPYGSNAYGVEAASQKYFAKSVKDVNLAEAAILAAIVQVPTRYSPYGPNKDILLARKDYVLQLMSEQGYISPEERDAAQQQEIVFSGQETNITAPHFVMYIRDILATRYGEKMIEQGGLKIYTTLDLDKQKIAEEVIAERTKDYPEKYNATNASLVAIDPKTGQILVMVGSRDYFNNSIDGQVNVSTRPRQPGSSMKPIVYGALFEKGYTPDTILYDVLTNFSTDPNNPYQPRNYNGQENGPVTVRKALAGSLNIPAVKALYLAGINDVLDLSQTLGYTTFQDRSRFGLALVLGGGEVQLLEHTNAFSAFARDGLISPIASILRVEDRNGRVIEEFRSSERKVLESQVARMMNSVLSDNGARAYIFGTNNSLTLGSRPVAAKTGTTNDYKDAWTVGYTPSIVTGVWVGNSNNKEMSGRADGSVVAAPIWRDFMSRVLEGTPVETFKEPDNFKTGKPILDGVIPKEIVRVDITTGRRATADTPEELIREVEVNTHHSILYYVKRDDPRGEYPSNPGEDPQFAAWESAVRRWAGISDDQVYMDPIEEDDPANIPQIQIYDPLPNQTISTPELSVSVGITSLRGVKQTSFYIDGDLWETVGGPASLVNKRINGYGNGYHSLTVRACDDVENCGEASVNFNLLLANNDNPSVSRGSVRIVSPTGGSVDQDDFPLTINLQVSNRPASANLTVYARNESGSTNTLASVPQVDNGRLSVTWTGPPSPGTYSLYTELSGGHGEDIRSQEIRIIVN